jgi:hypothetical protein
MHVVNCDVCPGTAPETIRGPVWGTGSHEATGITTDRNSRELIHEETSTSAASTSEQQYQ